MILLYAAEKNRVVETLEAQLAGHKITRCRTVGTMVKRLRRPRHGVEIVLLIVNSPEEMAPISEIQNLVRDMRVVIVLPRHDAHMVAWGHRLGSRFIEYADNVYERVGAVLTKMIRRPSRQPVGAGRQI